MLRRLWKRYVVGQPDGYRAYVSFPTDSVSPAFDGYLRERIDDLERVTEGRIDVYARVSRVVIVTDYVPAEQFDVEAFAAVLERIEDYYAGTHSLARLEKWRSFDDELVKSFVAVPVQPLFPEAEADRPPRCESPAD